MPLSQRLLEQAISVEGPETAPPLLFIHGVHLGRFSWGPHVQLLRDRYRVITLDLPRHGTLFAVPFTEESVIELLRFAANAIAGMPPTLVGYSLGGYCAELFAARHPELSNGVVLAGSSLDPTGWRRPVYHGMVGAGKHIPRNVFEATSALFFRMTLPPDLAHAIITNPFNRQAFAETRRVIEGRVFSTMLQRYLRPILIVNAEFDLFFRPEGEHFARAMHASHHLVRGSDHVFPLRRPQEFCDIVDAFARMAIAHGP